MTRDLNYFKELAARLLNVGEEGAPYRKLMEKALGFSLRDRIISAAEHVAPFNLATTLSFLLPFSATAQRLGPNIKLLILPGSLIPLNNAHQPRGLYFAEHGRRVNFFPKKYEHESPLLLPPADAVTFQHELQRIGEKKLAAVFESRTGYDNFAVQLSDYMVRLYHAMLDEERLPQLDVLPFEELSASLLITLIRQGDPFIEALLFTRAGRRHVFAALQGVYCAWGGEKGSFLFWKKEGRAVARFAYNEADDVIESGSLRVPFEKKEIIEKLGSKELLPGVFLCFLVCSYLPNLPVVGGPKQYRYYAAMIAAANGLGVVHREESLSNLGYMDFKPERIRPGIPAVGTSAHLVQNPIRLADIDAALAATHNPVMI